MSGQVRIWQSFSCNNSSSYRLIARFSDATKAADVAAELEALRGPYETGALAQTVGFDWNEWFPYGEEEDPTVAAEGEVLAVYHSYCLGFPEEFTTWLAARGGEVEKQHAGAPQVSALFSVPDAAWVDELTEVFAGFDVKRTPRTPVKLPWASGPEWGETSFFCDGETMGFSAPMAPVDLPALKAWLTERGVTRPVLRLCAYDDTAKFDFIAHARCSGCGGALRYVEPKRYGLDAEQLACASCGAMYELAALRAPD